MARYKVFALYAALALAVIAPLFSAYVAHRAQAMNPVIRVDIEPYDPRDLMYGHYMQFVIRWNWDEHKPVPGTYCRTPVYASERAA